MPNRESRPYQPKNGHPPAAGIKLGDIASELDDASQSLARVASMLSTLAQNGTDGPTAEQHPRASVPLPDRLTMRQLSAIHAASKRAGLSKAELEALLNEMAAERDPARLSKADASAVLERLDGRTGYAS